MGVHGERFIPDDGGRRSDIFSDLIVLCFVHSTWSRGRDCLQFLAPCELTIIFSCTASRMAYPIDESDQS